MAQTVKNPSAIQEILRSVGQEDPLEKGMGYPLQSVFLPREFQGQRSLAGYSPWGLKESDMNE